MHFTVTVDVFFGLTQVHGPINRGEGLITISLWYLVNQSIINIMYELSEASLTKRQRQAIIFQKAWLKAGFVKDHYIY